MSGGRIWDGLPQSMIVLQRHSDITLFSGQVTSLILTIGLNETAERIKAMTVQEAKRLIKAEALKTLDRNVYTECAWPSRCAICNYDSYDYLPGNQQEAAIYIHKECFKAFQEVARERGHTAA
jgi:hypothetical protein